MTDEDGFRIEAALQYGFQESSHNEGADEDTFLCTQSQLIAFAKACERKGLADAITVAERELGNVSLLLSNPPKSSAAWDIRNALTKKIEALDAELTPVREAEEARFMTTRGYVRVDGGWVKL